MYGWGAQGGSALATLGRGGLAEYEIGSFRARIGSEIDKHVC